MNRVLSIIAITTLVMVAASESAFSAKKKLGAANADCSCNCFKDSTGEGPKQRIDVFFNGNCSANGGGCRIRQPDGSYSAGTLRNCGINLNKATGIQGGNSSEGAPVLSAD